MPRWYEKIRKKPGLGGGEDLAPSRAFRSMLLDFYGPFYSPGVFSGVRRNWGIIFENLILLIQEMDKKNLIEKKIRDKKVVRKKNWKKSGKKSPKNRKFWFHEKSRFSIFEFSKFSKCSMFFLKFLIFLKFQNFQNEKSPRLKNIFRSDFFYCRDIHLYYPKNAFRYNSWTGGMYLGDTR